MRVCLDPGHGGHDPGAVGATGLSEATVALSACLSLREQLSRLGHEVVLTREDDSSLSEDPSQDQYLRIRQAKAALSQVIVSVHCGAASDPSVGGVTTLYLRGDGFGALLAQHVQRALVSSSGGLRDRGIAPVSDLPQGKRALVPAIVAQLGYISNPTEEALLADAAWIRKVTEGIAQALAAWHSEQVTENVSSAKDNPPVDSSEAGDTELQPLEALEAPADTVISQSSPHVVHIVPIMQAHPDVPGQVAGVGASCSRRLMPPTPLRSTAAEAIPGAPVAHSGVPESRSAAAQGIRVTTTVRPQK